MKAVTCDTCHIQPAMDHITTCEVCWERHWFWSRIIGSILIFVFLVSIFSLPFLIVLGL